MAPRPKPIEEGRRRAEILEEVLRWRGAELRRQAGHHSIRPENAGDALDDACVAFLRSYDGEPGIDALRYMMVVVKTAAWAIDKRDRELLHRQAGVFPATLKVDPLTEVPDPGDAPDEQFERSELVRERFALIAALKPDERTALVLFASGYSYREIGERKGWTYTKVNRCVAEGRRRLGELLAAEREES